MTERDLLIVGPDHVLALPDSDVVIRIDEAEDDSAESIVDPNTGERVVLPRPAGPRSPAVIGRPTTRRSGRMRDYLRLVEGA